MAGTELLVSVTIIFWFKLRQTPREVEWKVSGKAEVEEEYYVSECRKHNVSLSGERELCHEQIKPSQQTWRELTGVLQLPNCSSLDLFNFLVVPSLNILTSWLIHLGPFQLPG